MSGRSLYFVVVSAIGAALSAGPQAQAADLNGAWTNDLDSCGKVFTHQGGKIGMSTNADFYGSGFVIDGNVIRGKSATCRIRSMSQNGDAITISAACATDVMVSDTQFSLVLGADGRLTRSFPGMPEMTMDYFRCKF
jgi:hypothetical protein